MMTKQQKKIIKKIKEIENYIEMDEALGYGFAPEEFYEPFEEKVMALQEQLSYISHHKGDTVKKKSSKVKGWILGIALFLYDAFVVNFAYFLAILVRFSDSDSYNSQGRMYMARFKEFAPWYMIACLLIFIAFRLYSGVWRYAGLNDFKKLLLINSITCVIYIIGSLLIVVRMPITVYLVGAGIQFIMMCIPRLAPRYIIDSFLASRGESGNDIDIPLMIIGIGENARIIQDKIARDKSSRMNPVCIIDYTYGYSGRSFNGLPVFSGPYAVYECIKKFNIRSVMIADKDVPAEFLASIRKICEKKSIEIRDFVIDARGNGSGAGIRELLDIIEGSVQLVVDDDPEQVYTDRGAALEAISDNCEVKSISVKDGTLLINVFRVNPNIQ